MKMQMTTDSVGRVTLAYDDDGGYGEPIRVTRTFSCPLDGGYVVELQDDGSTRQPCDRLDSRGSTLMASSRAALPDVIRREYRAMRRKYRALDAY